MDGHCIDCKHAVKNNGVRVCETIFQGIILRCEDDQSNHAIEVEDMFGCVYFEGKCHK